MAQQVSWGLAHCGVVTGALPLAAADPYAPQVGQPHADFVLPRIDDRRPGLRSRFRGMKALLIPFAS